jgi:GTPase SAR1 family protein
MVTGAELIIPAGKLVATTAPSLLKKGTNWWKGRKLAVYGQPESGKTSFIRFLLTSRPADPDESRTIEPTKHGLALLKVTGPGQERQIVLRHIRDRAGQVHGAVHASEFCVERPHQAMVFLDLSRPYGGQRDGAIEKYATAFVGSLLANPKFNPNKLERIWFVLNKRDLVRKDAAEKIEKQFKLLLKRSFSGRLLEQQYRVRMCSLVDTPAMEKLRYNLVYDLAASIRDS